MTQRTKNTRPKKKTQLPLQNSNLTTKKPTRTQDLNEPQPSSRTKSTPKPTVRKRPPPADSESEGDGATTRKTPKRAVRQKLEKVPTRKQTVSEKKEPPLETHGEEEEGEEEEEPQVPTKKSKKKKKKIVGRKKRPAVTSENEETTTCIPSSKKKLLVEKPNSSFVDHVDDEIAFPKKRTGSRSKKVVVGAGDSTEGGAEENRPRKQSSGSKKTLTKSPANAIQGDANETSEVDCDEDASQLRIAKKGVRRNVSAKTTYDDRALKPMEISAEQGEMNVERRSPVVAKKKVIKKVAKKKPGKVVKQAPPTDVEDANENVPEEQSEPKPLAKKTTTAKRRSFVSVELPLTPSRKRSTVSTSREPVEEGNMPEQRVEKVAKKSSAKQKAPLQQHSSAPTNRSTADTSRPFGNGNGDEESECTTNEAAVPKKSVKRRTHALEEASKRRTLGVSKTQPSSVQDSAAEENDDDDDDGTALKSIRHVKKKIRIPSSDGPSMSSRPSEPPAKLNKRSKVVAVPDDSTEVSEDNRPRKQISRQKKASSSKSTAATILRVDSDETSGGVVVDHNGGGGSGAAASSSSFFSSSLLPQTPRSSSPPHSYGKPFVFSGISTGDHHDTVIALPTSDTPMIQKNREFREAGGGMNRRRSSFAMRGKRASSMSGGSLLALPHPDVPSEAFFRHIAAEAPEPVRMKQLLAWCARRVEIPAGRGVDPQALEIAQQVRERIIHAILGGKISTSWYNRKEDDVLPEISGPKELKEHPQNVDNRRLLKEHEDAIERLEREDAAWTATLREYNSRHAAVVDSCPILSDEPVVIDVDGEGEERQVMREAMDGAMAAVEERLLGDGESTDLDDEWLESTMAEVEIKVDRLHSALHTAAQFSTVSRDYTEDLFAKLLASLSVRRRGPTSSTKTTVDPIEVLRTLAAAASSSSSAADSAVPASSSPSSSATTVQGTCPS